MAERPGVMIYFDVLPVIDSLNNSETAKLFRGILEYGKYGAVPEFKGKLLTIWPLIQQRLDHDAGKYSLAIQRRKYAAYSRWERSDGRIPLPFQQWQTTVDLQGEEIQEGS